MEGDIRFFRNIIGYRTLKEGLKNCNRISNIKNELLKKQYLSLIKQIDNNQIFAIDRIEETLAVCENRETREIINITLSDLPADVSEGDIIIYRNNKFELDEKQKETIQERINNKVKDLFID